MGPAHAPLDGHGDDGPPPDDDWFYRPHILSARDEKSLMSAMADEEPKENTCPDENNSMGMSKYTFV